MSVFTKDLFSMSALPTPVGTAPPTPAMSRRNSFVYQNGGSGSLTPATDPHIVEIAVESVLFDMDGTLINSSPAVVKAWELFGQSYDLDLDDILRSAHGMRTIDVLKKWCKITDPTLLASEVIRFETAILNSAEELALKHNKPGIEVLPGVAKLLSDLGSEKDKRNGEEKWAICTSSTHFYAGKAIPIAGLPVPNTFVTADSVTRGKPFPDPYLLGAEGCDASPFESIVVEDAPTGIRSGKAAGCLVLATCTSHSRESLEKERPDFLVEDLSHVTAKWDATLNAFRLIIEQPIDRVQPRATPDVTPAMTPSGSRAGSRANSFSGTRMGGTAGTKWKGSDELTGNDSVIGTPAQSRPGSPGAGEKEKSDGKEKNDAPVSQGGFTLDALKAALAGNAQKSKDRGELGMEE